MMKVLLKMTALSIAIPLCASSGRASSEWPDKPRQSMCARCMGRAEMTLFATQKVQSGWLKRGQELLKSIVGYTIPVAWGTGGFGGFMPGRGPLNIYVGDAIDVAQSEFIAKLNENEREEEAVIEHLMDLYEADLQRLHSFSKWPQKLIITRL